jgi:DNA-binding transcriptional ArsR family regulator
MSVTFPDQVEILHLSGEQVLTLSSATCNEVFSTLGTIEPLSVREVAQVIDRSPAAVGEQIAKLVEVGLVISAGARKRRSRTETLYVQKGLITRFILRDQPKEALEAYKRRFSGQMRLAERQFEAFTDAYEFDPSLQDFLVYKTLTAHLSRDGALRVQLAVAELLDLIRTLDQTDSNLRATGEFVRVTLSTMLLPTQQESQQRARETKGK